MNINGKEYKIEFDEKNNITMSGMLAAMPDEYEKIETFFEKIIEQSNKKELILDLRELSFLNSSGIKSICVALLMEIDEIEGFHLKVLGSTSTTWQVETIPTFEDLIDNLEIVLE